MPRLPVAPDGFADARQPGSFAPFPAFPSSSLAQLTQWLDGVRIHPHHAIEWQCHKEWALGPRVINDSMWFWFESGEGWGRVGAEGEAPEFDIRPGDLMLIPQGAEHTIRQTKGAGMHLFCIHFHAQVLEGINLLDLLGFPAHLPGSRHTPYGTASRGLAREFALKAPGWRPAMAAEILQVLLYIVRHHGRDFHPPGTGQAHAHLPRLLPALEWIDRNLPDAELNLNDLAKQVFLSQVQFRKLFRRVTGVSPVRFIQRRRVERACSLLHGSSMSVEEIARACGFVDAAFFCRVFKRWSKTTATRYRQTAKL